MRCLEFFAGVGGFACAARESLNSIAIDINLAAREVYQSNWSGTWHTREILSLTSKELSTWDAQLWWLSPPCQPYSRRGNQRDLSDPRSESLMHLIALLEHVRPQSLALENVPGFVNSQAHELLRAQLAACGYTVSEIVLCPTQMGWPNRRERFYLLASQQQVSQWLPLPRHDCALHEALQAIELSPSQLAELAVDAETVARFGSAMDRVTLNDPQAVTACFGSSYGKSLLHAGSYLVTDNSWRRFHPREVAALLGFPSSFRLPSDMSHRQLWKLLGNSLSIHAVRYVLQHLRLGV